MNIYSVRCVTSTVQMRFFFVYPAVFLNSKLNKTKVSDTDQDNTIHQSQLKPIHLQSRSQSPWYTGQAPGGKNACEEVPIVLILAMLIEDLRNWSHEHFLTNHRTHWRKTKANANVKRSWNHSLLSIPQQRRGQDGKDKLLSHCRSLLSLVCDCWR